MLQRPVSQFVLPVLIVGIGAAGLVWLSAKDTPPERVAQQPTPPLIETVALQSDVPDFQIQVNGNVVPSREVTLSAEVDGAVTFKGDSIESGRQVSANAPLLQIDRSRLELQVNKMGSEIEQVEADQRQLMTEEQGTKALIELAKREVKLAEAASKRLEALVRKNAASDAEAEAVERTELQARNTLRLLVNQSELIPIRRDRLQAQLDLARFERSLAQLNLEHTKIVAPFAAVITSVMVEQGDYVQAGDPLLKLVDMSTVDVECSLQLDDLYWLWNSTVPSDPADDGSLPASNRRKLSVETSTRAESSERFKAAEPEDTVDRSAASERAVREATGRVFEVPNVEATVTSEVAGRQFHWKGRLAHFEGGGINRNTRTVLCRVHVAQPIRDMADHGPPALMRGMYVTVTLNIKPRTKLHRIPTRAVQPNGQVLTVDRGVLRVHLIRPAKVLADSVLVRTDATDLARGDRVVITQMVAPLDGSAVREIARDTMADELPDGVHGDVP